MQVAAGRDIFQTGHVSDLLIETFHSLGDVGPEGIFIGGGDDAHQREAPGLRGRAGETQAAKGNGHHGRESLGSQAAFGVPQRIEAEVVILTLAFDRVGLNPVRIHKEFVAALVVVVGVEDDAHHVIAEDVFALGHAGAGLAGR